MTGWPATTGPLVTVFVSRRSFWALTGCTTEAVSSAGSGSGVSELTRTVLVIARPAISGSRAAVTCSTTTAPGSTEPRVQVTSAPSAAQLPAGSTAETSRRPAGRVSTTRTARASEGPRFVTVTR